MNILRRLLIARTAAQFGRHFNPPLRNVSGNSSNYPASQLIREKFVKYFESNSHASLPSSSLVPDDASLLFTNAGMVQFKDVFLRKATPPSPAVVTVQKCMRAGGKHNDLDNVGVTRRHHTFFEMLGNFSFGGYFREDALRLAWQFVTKELDLPVSRLRVTVLEGDTKSISVWKAVGVPSNAILECGKKDNFWMMGATGPCGPCTEIFYDLGPHIPVEDERWLEIWNIVLMENEISESGEMRSLPVPCIDTGMGLERTAAILQGVSHNYATDELSPVVRAAHQLLHPQATWDPREWDESALAVASRVLADHARAALFLVCDGVVPSNTGRGYVLRRIIRRAARFAKRQGVPIVTAYRLICPGYSEPILDQLLPVIVNSMQSAYPELGSRATAAASMIRNEEQLFHGVLGRGWEPMQHALQDTTSKGSNVLPAPVAFQLISALGVPIDVIRDECARRGMTVDDGIEDLMQHDRAKSRAAWMGSGSSINALDTAVKEWQTLRVRNNDVALNTTMVPKAVVRAAVSVDGGKHAAVCIDPNPFYARGGGQVGDCGLLVLADGQRAHVLEAVPAYSGATALVLDAGSVVPNIGDEVAAYVDTKHRAGAAAHHTATHLLNAALRAKLGPHVVQAGSLVTPDRLRFDFTHGTPVKIKHCAHFVGEALTRQQLRDIETWVQTAIARSIPVSTTQQPYATAVAAGAACQFGEKYGDVVRVVEVKDTSLELCGGTHATSTSDLIVFKIVDSSSIAAGTRRIEAVCSQAAVRLLSESHEALQALALSLEDLPARIERLSQRIALLEQEVLDISLSPGHVIAGSFNVDGRSVVLHTLSGDDKRLLKAGAQKFLQENAGAAHVIVTGNRVAVACSPELSRAFPAKQFMDRIFSSLGGKGGGSPTFAQGVLQAKSIVEVQKLLHEFHRG